MRPGKLPFRRARYQGDPTLGHVDVAVLGINFPPEPTGIAPYTGALTSALSEAGYRTEAYVAHPHYPNWKISEDYGQWSRDEVINGVRVRRLLHYVPRSPRGVKRLLSELSFGIRLAFARWGSSRVVIAVSPSLFSTAIAVARLLLTGSQPSLVVWLQDIYTLGLAETGEGGGIVRRLTRRVESFILRAADHVVVIHERFATFVTSELGVSPARVVVVRNWTHLPPSEIVDVKTARSALRWPSQGTLAVHTGNMGAKQGLENIVDAARIADDLDAPVHFVLVGDGGERRKLEQLALGVTRIAFVDPLADDEYRLALSAADVLIVNEKPGVSGMAVPSKLTSYFDAGRPVIAATDERGITAAEVAAAEAGVTVPAGEPAALLEAVLAIGADKKTATRFGTNGRRYREAVLGEQAAVRQWLGLIDEVMSGNPQSGAREIGRRR